MQEIFADITKIGCCGLYCGACKKFLKGKCLGCLQEGGYSKCKMRPCCRDNQYRSCADCREFEDVMKCRKFTNPLWNALEFIFGTKRSACIDSIKHLGYDGYANSMTEKKIAVFKRKHR